jgi:hypothetical protein
VEIRRSSIDNEQKRNADKGSKADDNVKFESSNQSLEAVDLTSKSEIGADGDEAIVVS